jgi:PadR family transcriptional regulator, regulatory protein PadR
MREPHPDVVFREAAALEWLSGRLLSSHAAGLPANAREDEKKIARLIWVTIRLINGVLLLTEWNRATLTSVTKGGRMNKPTDLVQCALDLLILKILALEPLHGRATGRRLNRVSGDVLQVSDGSLYPALRKPEQEGWITAEWKPSENNRLAKFYSLTRLGRKELEKEAANWHRLSTAISLVAPLKEA